MTLQFILPLTIGSLIEGNRQGVSQFLHEIFGDIFTKKNVEQLLVFR